MFFVEFILFTFFSIHKFPYICIVPIICNKNIAEITIFMLPQHNIIHFDTDTFVYACRSHMFL